jgi:GNAT superfamily N-acetyltransferase
MIIRPADLSESSEICTVLRRSISELCEPDHQNIPEVLCGWLDNKTPDNVEMWIGDRDQTVLVAIIDHRVAGAGAANKGGEICLNYVCPDFRIRGVSKAVLLELERYLVANGKTVAQLTSTATAHRFYISAGYTDDGAPKLWRGNYVFPMCKRLVSCSGPS